MIFCLFLQVDVDLYNEYLPCFFPRVDNTGKNLEPVKSEENPIAKPTEVEETADDEEIPTENLTVEDDKSNAAVDSDAKDEASEKNEGDEIENSAKNEEDCEMKSTNPLLQ